MDTEELDPIERLLAERACERLIVEFVTRLDLADPGSVADLFTPDGSWQWPADDRRVQGREALRDYFGSRPADRLSRRMMANLLITVTSAQTATGTSYFATYRVDGWTGRMLPATAPTQVGHYEDVFVRADGRWLLQDRILHLPFGGPTARASA